MDKKEIVTALKKVIDPEIGINIVDLGLVYGVKIEKYSVDVKMTLTTPHCPMQPFFVKNVEDTIKSLGVKKVNVEIVFDPPWSPEKMDKAARKNLGF